LTVSSCRVSIILIMIIIINKAILIIEIIQYSKGNKWIDLVFTVQE